MNLAQYLPLALRTEAPLPTAQDRLEHALLGLISETGETATEIKRIVIYGKDLDSLAKDGKTLRAHIAEELGDKLWYLAIADDALGSNVFASFELPTDFDMSTPLKFPLFGLASLVGAMVDPTMSNAHEELPDLMTDALRACFAISQLIGVPFEQIAADNIAKLTLRYPDKFSAEAAEARADKGGLDARNS